MTETGDNMRVLEGGRAWGRLPVSEPAGKLAFRAEDAEAQAEGEGLPFAAEGLCACGPKRVG